MRTFATSMRTSGSAARRGLGVLVVVWLNLAITPCAMAFGAEHACDHMPTAGAHDMPGHHDHDADHQAANCHGTNNKAPSCDSLQAACCDLADVTFDARSDDKSLQKPSGNVALTASGYEALHVFQPATAGVAFDPPDPPPERAARHALFCVYLD
jgi:hypothetical protein